MTNLLTPAGEINHEAVRREAFDRAIKYRMRGCDWAVSTSLARVFRTTLAGVQREAERDRDDVRDRQRRLRMTLRESAILETSLLMKRAQHGLAIPYDHAEVERITAKLNALLAEHPVEQLQAAE